MEVVILCGGQGTRIRDVDPNIPKPMIPIGPRPILWHIMKSYAHFGFNRFVLCLGHRSWDIKRYFLDYLLAGSDFTIRLNSTDKVKVHGPRDSEDWQITMAETGERTMTGGRVKAIERYVTGENFMLTYGDGVADVDVRRLVDFHVGHGKTGTVTAVQPPGRFGEIELEGARVAEFNEKPLTSRGRISGGFFVLHRRFFDRLGNDPDLVLEQQPLRALARDGELMSYRHDGFWHPMDSSRDYQTLNAMWSRGDAPWALWNAPKGREAA